MKPSNQPMFRDAEGIIGCPPERYAGRVMTKARKKTAAPETPLLEE
jgi:hypothetical protein